MSEHTPLHVKDLTVTYGSFTAVRRVTLEVRPGTIVGLVGESGSGKSTLGRALVGLVPIRSGEITGPPPSRRQMIFQDPQGSFNPRRTFRRSIEEALERSPKRALQPVGHYVELVGLDQRLAERYPREVSGGQRQRMAIARALAFSPELIVADEITSALDVSAQASVLNLLRGLQEQLSFSCLFITHNLAVVRWVSHHLYVMREGSVVEEGPTEQVLVDPVDNYTQELVSAVPQLRESEAPNITSADREER